MSFHGEVININILYKLKTKIGQDLGNTHF